jgi:hypothetical protein
VPARRIFCAAPSVEIAYSRRIEAQDIGATLQCHEMRPELSPTAFRDMDLTDCCDPDHARRLAPGGSPAWHEERLTQSACARRLVRRRVARERAVIRA